MKRAVITLILWLFIIVSPLLLNAQPCASNLYLQQRLQAQPQLIEQRQALEAFTQRWIAENANQVSTRAILTIPVVVHIVWKEVSENVPEEQIQAQLDIINRDFRAKNLEINAIPAVFKTAVADVEIEFCLAKRTPNGQVTSGITRTRTNVNNVGVHFTQPQGLRTICYSDLGGQDAWDTRQYLNIWVGSMGFGILGQADFPGIAEAAEDGIRIDPSAFGTSNATPPYNLGRTLTHEIGHYFNLSHPWGNKDDNLNCENDDGVSDTPRQSTTFRNQCPTHPQLFCGTASMFMNFMNYTNDACLAMFTQGQKVRMLAALNVARVGLLNSSNCLPPSTAVEELFSAEHVRILGNPIVTQLHVQATAEFQEVFDIQFINIQGQLLFSDRWNTTNDYIKSVSNFNPGLYCLILKSSHGILYKKILISR